MDGRRLGRSQPIAILQPVETEADPMEPGFEAEIDPKKDEDAVEEVAEAEEEAESDAQDEEPEDEPLEGLTIEELRELEKHQSKPLSDLLQKDSD